MAASREASRTASPQRMGSPARMGSRRNSFSDFPTMPRAGERTAHAWADACRLPALQPVATSQQQQCSAWAVPLAWARDAQLQQLSHHAKGRSAACAACGCTAALCARLCTGAHCCHARPDLAGLQQPNLACVHACGDLMSALTFGGARRQHAAVTSGPQASKQPDAASSQPGAPQAAWPGAFAGEAAL